MKNANPMHRSSRRLAVLAGALALCVAGPAQGPRVTSLHGQVEIGRGDPPVWRPAQSGDALAGGDAVRTGHDGRAELDLGRGTVRLYGNSLLRLPLDGMESQGARSVDLERGHSLFDVLRRDAEPFEVRTGEVVVSVKGTRFSVGVDELVEVAVYRGLVGVLARDAERAHETLVREGFAAVGGSSRPFELFLLEATDPWGAWSMDAMPPDLEHRALRGAAPAKLAVGAAERAASQAFRPEALELAMQRRPEVAERVAQLARERRAARPAGSAVTPELESSDPVLDASARLRREALEVPFVESWLASQDPTGGATTGTNLPYDLTVLGADQILIAYQDGSQWTLDEALLAEVLVGTNQLPSSLETKLQQSGVNDLDTFVRMLVLLLDGS